MRSRFGIRVAEHYGMCFGVRDALAVAERVAEERPATILGELVHNEVVQERLRKLGLRSGSLSQASAATEDVIVTAHGAADRDRDRWREQGHVLTDTTCPLVRKAHGALAALVAEGCLPVIIGKEGHVEVNGLARDFPDARIVLSEREIEDLPFASRIGVVSQTTQPIDLVEDLVGKIRRRHPEAKVVFRDTVCQPTKNRQKALLELCLAVDLVLVVGGKSSNNTRQLVEKARRCGCRAERVARAEELKEHWLDGVETVGVTAGTSTLLETVGEVVSRLEQLGGVLKGGKR